MHWCAVRRLRLPVEIVALPQCWVAESDARLVESWTPDDERPEIVEERLVWHPAGASEPLTIDLPLLFKRLAEESGRRRAHLQAHPAAPPERA